MPNAGSNGHSKTKPPYNLPFFFVVIYFCDNIFGIF